MKRVILSLLGSMFLQVCFSQAEQTLNKVVIAPPTAAALIKYADIPVNYHTGIPSIGVPIYTLKEGVLEVPISLNYHAGGIKLDEIASWVGLGWSLNSGGVITRTVMGTPDENFTSEFGKNEKSHLSNNGYNNYYFRYDNISPLTTDDVAYFNDITSGVNDGEPDLFFFNFNGYSGKFYFNDDGKAMLLPETDLKIDYTFQSGSGSIKNFIITTIDGTKYHFGRTDDVNDVDPIEMTHNYYTGEDNLFYAATNGTIASWYLNKIVSADNQFTITFTYSSEQYSYNTVQGKPYTGATYPNSGSSHAKYYGHWVQGVRLASISSQNVTIYFDPGSSREDVSEWTSAGSMADATNTIAKTLGAIRITTNQNDCRKFLFSYDYFLSATTGLPSGPSGPFTVDLKRLKLTEVKEQRCDGSHSLTPYVFDYFTEALPRRLSFAKDHWGFINGKTSNDRLIPTFQEKLGSSPVFNEIAGADRDSYWPEMRAGTLKKINYPTGGYTEFDFEANTTYLNYSKLNKVLSFTMSAGYTSSTGSVTQNKTFNSAAYSVRLINQPTGQTAGFSGVSSIACTATPGQTTIKQGSVTAGTYPVTLQKFGGTTGNGASVQVYEYTSESVQENKIVGGLRIKSISHNDGGSSPAIVTNYDYNLSNSQSSGHLYSRPTYVQIVRSNWLRDVGMYLSSTGQNPYCSQYGYEVCSGDPYLISPNSLRPMETTQGNHIGYNEVKVSQTNNGYQVFRYYGSNVWDDIYSDVADRVVELQMPQSNDVQHFPAAPPKTDFKRGELKYEAAFNQANQIVSEAWYYPEYTENPLKTPALLVASGTAAPGLPTFYDVVTAKKTKLTVQSRIFQPGAGDIENTVENFYNSDQHTQLSKKVETNSKEETIESVFKYAADLKPASCTTISDGSATYASSCTTCQSQYNQDRIASGHNDPFWKYWDYHKYLKCLSEARKTFFAARKNYYNPGVSGSYAQCMVNAKANASADLKPYFELHEKGVNLPIEIYKKKNSNLVDAIFSKYIYGTAPSDMVYLNSLQKINIGVPSSTLTTSSISGNNLVKDSRYEDEGSVIMLNGNVSQVNGKDGVVTSYVWGYNKSYPVAQIVGAGYSSITGLFNQSVLDNPLSTETQIRSELNNIRSGLANTKAQVTTYTYKSALGVTSQTDSNNKTIYYEYDGYGRLKLIRDHDNNILKKFCYNYAGQIENCQ